MVSQPEKAELPYEDLELNVERRTENGFAKINKKLNRILGLTVALILIFIVAQTSTVTRQNNQVNEKFAVPETETKAPFISKREEKNVTVALSALIDHPTDSDLKIFPLVYPNVTADTSAKSSRGISKIDKRYLWWDLGFTFRTDYSGPTLGSLAGACQDYSNDYNSPWGQVSCVYAAMATLMVVAGAGWSGYDSGAGIWGKLQSGYQYRDQDGTSSLEAMRQYQLISVNTTGLPLSPVFDSEGNVLTSDRAGGSPVLFGYDFNGVPAHLSYNYMGGANNSLALYFKHQTNSTSLSKREKFNDQDFSSGGIEAGLSYNQQSDGGWLDPSNDYGQMDHQISCYGGDLNNNAAQIQIFDNNHSGTIAAGILRACGSGAYDTGSLFDFTNLPTPSSGQCTVSK